MDVTNFTAIYYSKINLTINGERIMKKIKKLLALSLFALTLLCLCLAFAGCSKEETKYDVTFVLVCQESSTDVANPTGPILESWVITPEQHSIEINREYDGKMYMYYVYQYKLEDHPDLGDEWFLYPRISDNFQTKVFTQGRFASANGNGLVVKYRGLYTNEIQVNDLISINPKRVTLFITVS